MQIHTNKDHIICKNQIVKQIHTKSIKAKVPMINVFLRKVKSRGGAYGHDQPEREENDLSGAVKVGSIAYGQRPY